MFFFKKKEADGVIGLIAGQGEFPILFARAASSLGKKVVLIAVREATDRQAEEYAARTHYVGLGALGDLARILRQENIKQVVLAGGIPKKELYNPEFKLDDAAKKLMSRISNKGDDHLLKAFELFLKASCGVSIVDSRLFLKDAMAVRGVMTRESPTPAEWNDLKFGWKVSKGIGGLDIGQTVVVKNGVVLAVEAIEGTDQAIRRGGELGRGGAVVVKTSKPKQALRFDLPCVGQETVVSLRSAGCRILGLESGKTIMLFKEKVLEAANRENMVIVGL